MYIFAKPLGYIIKPIYDLIQNYGLTLILVTLLIRIVTLPLSVMSQKSTARTQKLQPQIQALQQKYKNDKEKLNTEMQKLYSKNNVNPLGGCLPLIVQMFVLFGFIKVIYNPLQYILRLSEGQINQIMKEIGEKASSYQVSWCGIDRVKDILINELHVKPINFNFFGIDLTQMLKGNLTDWKLWVFPVLATVATILSTVISKKQMAPANNNTENAAPSMNAMLYVMPVMTAYFTYIMPAGMSLYWFVSTAFQLIQQTALNNWIKKKIDTETDVKGKKA